MGNRPPAQDLASQAPPQPARPRARGRRLHAPPELRRDRPLAPEREDGPAPRRAARRAAARAQPAAARRRATRPSTRSARWSPSWSRSRTRSTSCSEPRAVPGDRRRPRLEPRRRQRGDPDAPRKAPRRTCSSRRSTCCGWRCTPTAWRRGSPTSASGAPTCSATSRRRSRHATELDELYAELSRYPGPRASPATARGLRPAPHREPDGLRFLSTRTTFATAVDVTVSELAIESFFPADEATRRADARAVQPVRPVAAVRRQPAIDLGQRRRFEPVPALLRVDPHPHEPRLAQHPQMLGHAGLRQPQDRDELAHRPLALEQQVQDLPPARIRQDVEHRQTAKYDR